MTLLHGILPIELFSESEELWNLRSGIAFRIREIGLASEYSLGQGHS